MERLPYTSPPLSELLAAANAKPMTPEQEREQRISFVYGNVGMSNPDVTRKMVEDAVDGVRPAPRIGDWIQTFTGKAVYPMDLRPEDVCIEDIAHSLSMQCRFNGHCLQFYSVAEHSVLMARWMLANGQREHALAALLHDATEAYLTDVPRPVKPFLQGYKEAEHRAWLAVAGRFGLAPELSTAVHEADNRILFDEKSQNMGAADQEWSWALQPLGVTLRCWAPKAAREEYMATYWAIIETGRH